MRNLTYDQFLPVDYQQTLLKQYHHWQQSSRTMTEYVDEFRELRTRNDLDETESQEVLRFINGLREPLKSKVGLRVNSFPKTVSLTSKYESISQGQ